MAVSSWLNRRRLLRRDLTSIKEIKEEKDVTVFDPSKDEKENTLRILSNLCNIQGLTDHQKIAHLKALNKIIEQSKKKNAVFFMKNEHIFRCLKTCLTSKNSGVRTAGYRVIRNCVRTAEDVVILNDLQIPKLIVRTIDMGGACQDEMLQAFRLIVKTLMLNPQRFYVGLIRSLISLADSIGEVKDKMASSSVVILCYLCILNPDLLIECCGHSVLLRCALEVSDARLNECMLICLMFLMNKRDIRDRANIHLDYVISAYTELEEKRVEEESTPFYRINELSVLAILRSWVGIYHFCQPNISGIKVIVDVLYLNRDDLRKAVLELLYQIFGLDRKSRTDKLSVAIENIDPSKYHESWNVNQRFIVAEGRDILPHKNFYRPNLSEIHTSLVLYAFLECGILPALVEVIISPDAFLSIQALILLGVILHLSYKLLPAEIVDVGPGLPTLAEYITHGLPYQKTQALMAVSALCKIHEVLKRKPTPKSLFLKQLIFYSNLYKTNEIQGISNEIDDSDEASNETANENNGSEDQAHELHNTLNFYVLQHEFERRNKKQEMKPIDQVINKSNVLWFSDYREWNWDMIETSLKSTDESFVQLQEAYHKNYIKKLVHFFKPSSRIYSEIEYSYKRKELDILTTTALYLIDFLLQSDDGGKGKFLDSLLSDLSKELKEVVVNESLYTIFFNPRHMLNTMSQHYFLIIGRLSGTNKGVKALNRRSLLKICTEIVTTCRHEYYVKLIVSSLNYNVSSRNRLILSTAISSSMESVRNYSIELLLILARLDVQNFRKWGMDLLISLMYNKDKTIAATSINILQELCYDKVYLQSLVDAKPSVLHLLDQGNLLLIRFLSTQRGFHFLSKANYIETELSKWEKDYNYRYVRLIEDELNNALTLNDLQDYEKNFRRLTYNSYKYDDVFIPFHLYGELAKHEKGFESLVQNGNIFKMAENIHKRCCDTDMEILELKSSLWGVCSMSTSKLGFEFLDKENIIQAVVEIAYDCPVLSVRATAFYCISLISTTIAGADALVKFGWYTVRRNRSEEWPDMDIQPPLLDKLWRLKLEEKKSPSPSPSDVSPPNVDETDSVRIHEPSSHETNINLSPETTLTPREFVKETNSSEQVSAEQVSAEKESSEKESSEKDTSEKDTSGKESSEKDTSEKESCEKQSSEKDTSERDTSEKDTSEKEISMKQSTERESFGISQFSESEGEKFTISSSDVFEERPGTSESETYLKKNSSGNTSLDGGNEGTKKFYLWEAVNFYKLRSLYVPRKKPTPEADSKVQLLEDINSQTETVNTLSSSSSSQMDLTSEPVQETLTDKFELSYKGVSLPKSLSQIFTNLPNPNSGPNDQENQSGCGEEGILPNNTAGMEDVTETEEDSRRIPGTACDDGRFRSLFPHSMETCIGCCTKVCERIATTYPSGSDESKAESSNCDTKNADETPAPSENPPADDEVKQKEDTVPSEDMADKKDEPETSKEEDKAVSELRNYQIVIGQIMTQIGRMYNPVISKAARHELALLKQRYPSVFKDVCLYSNVCNLLSSSSCRLTSRNFIQQLFSDVVYCMVYDDAARALRVYIPANSSSMADILPLLSQSHSSVYKNGLPLQLYKPPQIRTIVANKAPVLKKNPFDDVPVTSFQIQAKEAHTQTASTDILQKSSQI